MKKIKHQQQPNYDTCTSACLAMILDLPVKDVIAEFHEDWMNRKSDPAQYLAPKGVQFEIHRDPYDNCLEWGKLYLMTAASVNVSGQFHHLLVDLRGGEDNVAVYDPNRGKLDKAYYVWHERQEIEQYQLKAWCIDMAIELGE